MLLINVGRRRGYLLFRGRMRGRELSRDLIWFILVLMSIFYLRELRRESVRPKERRIRRLRRAGINPVFRGRTRAYVDEMGDRGRGRAQIVESHVRMNECLVYFVRVDVWFLGCAVAWVVRCGGWVR
jgi:hypothetical protein